MKVLLFQLDGKIPNIALMRIAQHHRERGNEVELRHTGNPVRELGDHFDIVYGSAIFKKSERQIAQLREQFPDAIIGGTGVNLTDTLEAIGIETRKQDYSVYPRWQQSIGFTQRGCRLKCPFCVVPQKEGRIREEQTIAELWRGDPWARELILLDNDFFGQPNWRERIREIRQGDFKVSFNQGINVRFLNEESAEAIASVDYRDDSMKVKRIYTAWDNKRDERLVFRGLEHLVRFGVKPDQIMVYMLIGYWPGETTTDWVYRQERLREFGCRPYPMPFERTHEAIGFQRWVIGAYDKRFSWDQWTRADYRPENLGLIPERESTLEMNL